MSAGAQGKPDDRPQIGQEAVSGLEVDENSAAGKIESQ